VADPSLLARRPEMIKVANFPRNGRPHAGLSAADIVFDYYIGEGANRFLALFYGQDSKQVGPMRSGRYIDAELVPMYQGILGFIGAWLPSIMPSWMPWAHALSSAPKIPARRFVMWPRKRHQQICQYRCLAAGCSKENC